jgi:hypothetical protein
LWPLTCDRKTDAHRARGARCRLAFAFAADAHAARGFAA